MGEFILSRPEIIWFIIGFALLVLELVVPGFVIIFFGIGAWVTALLCLVANPGINLQVIVFITVSILSLIALRKFLSNKFFTSKDKHVVDADDDFTGSTAVVVDSFGPGVTGKVEYRGSYWNAITKADLKKGQEVVIVDKSDLKLIVEPK